jgi:sugar phosphate isomerase/epimerase
VKLSCLPVSLYPQLAAGAMTLGQWFRVAGRLGLDGADLSVAHLPGRRAASLRDLRKEAEDAGIAVMMLATYTDFTHPDPAYREAQIDELRRWIEVAERLGATFARVTAGQAHPGVPEAEGLDWAVEGLVACIEEAKSAGVRLAYENHTRGAVWQRNDFTQQSARFLEVVRRTHGTGLEVLFDTANSLVLNEDPMAVLEQVFDRIGVVHLSDIVRAGAFEHTLIGTGVAPLPAVLKRLSSGGFDGWISIEEASGTGEPGFRAAVAFAEDAWRRAGGTPRSRSPGC